MLLDDPAVGTLFPPEAVARARTLLSYFPGGLGAYSDSRGAPGIRQEVADFIAARDGGIPADPDAIFLTEGASPAVKYILNALIRDGRDGILVPIPQYPLYSATIQLAGGQLLGYGLVEGEGWGLDVAALRAQAATARAAGTAVRALVFINPGNPTGQTPVRRHPGGPHQVCARGESGAPGGRGVPGERVRRRPPLCLR